MASGMYTKQANWQSNKFLNQVNDAALGGQQVSVPAGVPQVTANQVFPGDRILLDDASALALSDTVNIGTLYGGIYCYVQTLSSSTASPARGTAAFFRAADLPSAFTPPLWQVTADQQPTTTVPSFFAGVFINPITKGNYGWVQVQGVASCLFDSTIAAATVGGAVYIRGANGTAATVAGTFDVGSAVATPGSVPIANTQISCFVGVAIVLPVVSTITAVLITRGVGRI